jgi:hypothetical protein
VVALSEQIFSEFIHELLTVSGAVKTGVATLSRGDLFGWRRWEPAIPRAEVERYGAEVEHADADHAWRSVLVVVGRCLGARAGAAHQLSNENIRREL